jgi:hypothetical protein
MFGGGNAEQSREKRAPELDTSSPFIHSKLGFLVHPEGGGNKFL